MLPVSVFVIAAHGRRDMAALQWVPGAGEGCLRQLQRVKETCR